MSWFASLEHSHHLLILPCHLPASYIWTLFAATYYGIMAGKAVLFDGKSALAKITASFCYTSLSFEYTWYLNGWDQFKSGHNAASIFELRTTILAKLWSSYCKVSFPKMSLLLPDSTRTHVMLDLLTNGQFIPHFRSWRAQSFSQEPQFESGCDRNVAHSPCLPLEMGFFNSILTVLLPSEFPDWVLLWNIWDIKTAFVFNSHNATAGYRLSRSPTAFSW